MTVGPPCPKTNACNKCGRSCRHNYLHKNKVTELPMEPGREDQPSTTSPQPPSPDQPSTSEPEECEADEPSTPASLAHGKHPQQPASPAPQDTPLPPADPPSPDQPSTSEPEECEDDEPSTPASAYGKHPQQPSSPVPQAANNTKNPENKHASPAPRVGYASAPEESPAPEHYPLMSDTTESEIIWNQKV
jgi:hypothetical protein